MRIPLFIYGAGGLGREVLSLIRLLDTFDVKGFVDDFIAKDTVIKGVPVVGIDKLKTLSQPAHVVIAVGDPILKKNLASKFDTNVVFATIVHPSVIIQDPESVQIGKGSILCAGSIITTDIKIGDHVLVNLNCTIGHDSTIDNYSSIMPGVNIAGQTTIGESVLIGSGTNILNNITIGGQSKIGMGAVVIRDVAPGVTVAGVPAKLISR